MGDFWRRIFPEHEPWKWEALAQYNAERSRGIEHTNDWKKIMASQQEQFNREQREDAEARGYIILD